MALWNRIINAFRSARLDRRLEDELRLHIEEATAAGRTENDARWPIGNLLRARERSHDLKVVGWLEALLADARFGARQLRKNWMVSSAAILSLALTIGASAGAFRLIDAVLLRPLAVAEPHRLFYLTNTYLRGNEQVHEGVSFSYPIYRRLRDSIRDDADLIAVAWAGRNDITYGDDADMEKAYQQYVSGNTFQVLGLHPTLGRLFTPADDDQPGAHPVAVISYAYWKSRFGCDPKALGRTFREGDRIYEIIGVGPKSFTGTQTGTFTGIFVPTMMNTGLIGEYDGNWLRLFVRPKAGRNMDALRDRLQAVFTADHRERVRAVFNPTVRPEHLAAFLNSKINIHPAASGASQTQDDYRLALTILGILVALVLLVATANVANLMTAQAAARAHEMALRVSIGAGRPRLIQLVLVESALLATAATIVGGLFAWWSAPLVASMVNPPDNPLQLALPADWRVLGFIAGLALMVMLLFGLAPALRASAIKPAITLKGGYNPHSQRRLIYGLIVAQVAFCFVVNFSAGLFVTSERRLSQQPTGFRADGVVLVNAVTAHDQNQPPTSWAQTAEGLRLLPNVESVSWSGWPLLTGGGWDSPVRLPGRTWDTIEPFFLAVSPSFFSTMRIGMLAGRDFTPTDSTGVAIVTEAFARHYFTGQDPIGRVFERASGKFLREQIIGVVRDVRYDNLREEIHPVVFLPAASASWGTFEVRVSSLNPTILAPALRAEVSRVHAGFRVSSINTQTELVDQWTIRERLLSVLSVFFAALALLLAAIGLYGVLNYSVVQRTREIGIRMALGARAPQVAWQMTIRVFSLIVFGIGAGLCVGLASQRLVKSLLYSVGATEAPIISGPMICLLSGAALATLPPILRAIRIDPSTVLRGE